MATDDVALLGGSAIELVGAEMTRRAASDVFKEAGIGPDDVQVVECHDCFSANEMYVPITRSVIILARAPYPIQSILHPS